MAHSEERVSKILLSLVLMINHGCDNQETTNDPNNAELTLRSEETMDSESSLTSDDFRNSDSVEDDPNEYNSAMMYALDKFEGDILMPNGKRSMTSDERKLWPDKRVPFAISKRYTEKERLILAKAIKLLNNQTCVHFEPKKSNDSSYIFIEPKEGCYTFCGRAGGKQRVSLAQGGCITVGTVQHELMHALGFYHEQSRYDRGKYVEILWDNVKKEAIPQFKKTSKENMNPLGEKYDIHSIMHYESMAFAKDKNKSTVLTKDGKKIFRDKLANANDIRKINKLYKCGEYGYNQTN